MAERSEQSYLPQLDGVRALAVSIVVISHFAPEAWTRFRAVMPTGLSGVDVFFVLSGFLITGILLRSRDAIAQGRASVASALRSFYFRRVLRIFPIYYLCLGAAVVLGIGITTHDLWWHVPYLSNFLMLKLGRFLGSATHLWSLSVEEQFYALWPAVVLATPRRYLRPLLVTLLVAGPLFRTWGRLYSSYFTHMLLPACVDLFALGALLAEARLRSEAACRRTGRLALGAGAALLGTVAILALCGVSTISGSVSPAGVWELARRSLAGLAATWLVSGAALGFSGALGALFESAPARYVGKISYGIYLVHNFLGEALHKLVTRWGLLMPSGGIALLMMCAVAVGLASLSWHFIEEPILRLKQTRFGRPAN